MTTTLKKEKRLHAVKINGRTLKLANADFPHNGKVVIDKPIIQERGADEEFKIYATCTDDTYEPGQRYVCFFSMKGKGKGYFLL